MEIAALGLRVDGAAGIDKATDALDGFAAAAEKAERAAGSMSDKAKKSAKDTGDQRAAYEQLRGSVDAVYAAKNKLSTGSKSLDSMLRQGTITAKEHTDTMSLLQQQYEKSTSRVSELASIARRAGLALGAAFSINALKNYADGWSDMQSKVGAATRDMDGAGARMQRLVDIANASYAPLQQTAQVYSQNVATFRDMGRSASDAADFTEAVNHALVTTATRGQDADVVIGSLSRSLATGGLDAQAFDTIVSRSPRVLQAMADHLGVTTSQLRAMAMQSKVTNDVIATGLIKSLPQLSNEAGQMPATLSDAFVRINNNLTEFVGRIDKATGVSSAIAGEMMGFADGIRAAGTYIIAFGSNVADALSPLSNIFESIGSQSDTMLVALAGLAAPTLIGGVAKLTVAIGSGLLGAVKMVTAAMLANPIGLFISALAAAGYAAYKFRDEIAEAIGVDVVGIAKTSANYLIASFVAAYEAIGTYWSNIGNVLGAAMVGAANAVIKSINWMVSTALEQFNNLIAGLNAIPVLNLEIGLINTGPAINELANTYADALGGAIDEAGKKITEAFGADYLGAAATFVKGLFETKGAASDAAENGIKPLNNATNAATKGANAAAAAYKSWTTSIAEKTAALREELDGTSRLTESQKLLIKLNAEVATGKTKLTATSIAKIKTDLAELAGLEKLRAETERSVKAYQEWIKEQEDIADAYVQLSKSKEDLQRWTYEENKALGRSGELLKLEASLIGATDKQRQIAVATLQSEILLRQQLDEINANHDVDEPAREEARIEARKRHAERMVQAETAIYIAEWDKTSQLIGQTLSDYIMGGGKDAAQYLKRLFATLVLQPIVNYGVQGVMGMFTGGQSGAAGQSGGGINASSLTGIPGVSALLGNGLLGLGGMMGSMGGFATGLGATFVNGAGFMANMGAGASLVGAGATGTGLGMIAGALGPIVAGIGVLASLFGAFDKPTPHQGAVGYYTTQGGSENYQAGQTQYNAEIGGILETLSSSVGASFEAFLTSFGLDNNVAVTTNWADDFNGKGESWGYFALAMQDAFGEWTNLVDWRENGGPEVREYAEGEAGFEEYALDVYRSFVDGLKQVDIPAWATGVLDQIGDDASLDQINAVLAQLGVMKDTLASWNTYLVEFANVGDAAFGALLESMGGFENLSTGVASFVDLFYSDAEKLEMSQKQIAEQLAKFDLKMPMLDMSDETMDTAEEVKAAWRSMVEEALAAGEEGAELAAMLLNLGPAFSSATDAAESAAQAEAELAQAREDARQAQIDGWMNLGGLSVQSMSQGVMDALQNGEDPGAWLAEHITGGFEQAMQMQALNMVMQRIMDEALAPAMEEIMTDLFGEKSDSTATTAEEAVLKVFDAMDAAFAAVTGESVLNLGAGQVSTGQVDGMQEISNDGLASLDTTMPEGTAFGSAFESVLVQMKPALEAFVNDLGLAGVEAVEGADLTATTDAISQLLGGLVSEESIAGIAEMLANLPEMDPEQAAAIASLTQESLEALLGGIVDGSLGLLDASVFANVAFGGMTEAIVAGSTDMLNATAGASMASSSAVVGHANAAINTIDGAVSFANGKLDEFLSSDLGKQLFGNIKKTPTRVTTPSYSSGSSGYESTIKSDASALISAWKSVYDAIYGSMTNLRDAILGTTEDEGNSFYEAQFAMLTAQARAGDQKAAEKLPELVAKLTDYAKGNSASLFDQNASIAGYINSLEDTQAYIAGFFKKAGGKLSDLEAWGNQSVYQAASVSPVNVPAKVIPAFDNSAMLNSLNSSNGNTALIAEVRAMRTELAAVKAELAAARSSAEDTAANTRDMSRTLNEVTNGGDAMLVREVTA